MKCHGNLMLSPRYGVQVLPMLHPSPLNMCKPEMREAFAEDALKLKQFL